VRLVNLDPDIMARLAALRDPHHHRQSGRRREEIRHLKEIVVGPCSWSFTSLKSFQARSSKLPRARAQTKHPIS
jgi:hypothetical protein